jgi:hypothetical protein
MGVRTSLVIGAVVRTASEDASDLTSTPLAATSAGGPDLDRPGVLRLSAGSWRPTEDGSCVPTLHGICALDSGSGPSPLEPPVIGRCAGA